MGRPSSTPIENPPQLPKRIPNIQYQFDNTFENICEYKANFSSIDFWGYIGKKCIICGLENCYTQIKEYYRYAIDLFPFKKEKVPVARFLCNKTGKTFSLLPNQLIPYCQYTVDAMIGTLLKVYQFQKIGQRGYYSASLELDPDCSVTPYLIRTWALLVLAGIMRGHHVLHAKYPFSASQKFDPGKAIETIHIYLQRISSVACSLLQSVTQAIRYFFCRTRKCLFGKTSCERGRAP